MKPFIAAVVVSAALLPSAGSLAADPLEASLNSCWSCHGAQSADPTVPIIQGQLAGYLEKQLRDFRGGTRDSQIMSSMAESVRPDDLARAAAIISGMAWPARKQTPAAPEPPALAACRACHGADLKGGPSPEGIAPRLAGQFEEYLSDQMEAISRGERPGAKAMTAQMQALSAEEKARIAKVLAGLRS